MTIQLVDPEIPSGLPPGKYHVRVEGQLPMEGLGGQEQDIPNVPQIEQVVAQLRPLAAGYQLHQVTTDPHEATQVIDSLVYVDLTFLQQPRVPIKRDAARAEVVVLSQNTLLTTRDLPDEDRIWGFVERMNAAVYEQGFGTAEVTIVQSQLGPDWVPVRLMVRLLQLPEDLEEPEPGG